PQVPGPFGLTPRRARSYLAAEPAPLLLKLEGENFDGSRTRRHQAHMLANSPMRAYIYALSRGPIYVDETGQVRRDETIYDLRVLKASEQSLGQLLPPPGEGSDWIERAAELELRRRLGLAHTE